MGRPKGSKNKEKNEDEVISSTDNNQHPLKTKFTSPVVDYNLTEEALIENADGWKEEEKKSEMLTVEKPKGIEPLAPGQAYFEAPDGTIIIGEGDKDQVWYRGLNGGKGGWINRKR